MTDHPGSCDRRLLRLSLEDRLTDLEQAELAAHLEGCESCRLELERLAAASGLWGEARALRGEPEPGMNRTIGLAAEDEPEDELEDEAWLAFLDPPDPDRPETLGRLAAYEVVEVLGRGGMGIVLKARDPALERTVAIKVLTPALAHGPMARRRFAREARAAAAVGHEHIVAIYAVDEFRGLPYLVMQYIPGRSLQDRLDASGPLEVKEILRIGTQAARALAAAHAQGVVHRDIKPANILLENCVERVKLTDFGLARAMDDASLTQSGVIAGTPAVHGPRAGTGRAGRRPLRPVRTRGVLYAMAVGRPPFRANSAMAVLKRVCDDRHRPIRELNPDVPDWLEAMIDRLLAKDPADRFQTAAEVADLLERGLAHVQQPTAVPRPVIGVVHDKAASEFEFDLPVAKAPARRRRLAVAAGFMMLSLAGLGASEAAGLTKVSEFVATVLRIKTAEGTLEVKVDDPDVKVDVDNECVIIGGAGPREIRLRTGQHRLLATRNGQPVKDELISIMKGKKQIVSIGFDPHVAVAVPPAPADRLMTAPASHTEQCMVCHKGPVAVDRPLPANHPVLGPQAPAWRSYTPKPALAADPIRARALVWSLAFTPDGRRLAIGQQGIDGRPSPLRLLDLGTNKDLIAHANPNAYRSLAFSPDGSHLATGTFDGTLQIWTMRPDGDFAISEQRVNVGSPVNALCFLDHGRVVATGAWDGNVRFWNVETAPERPPLSIPGRVFSIAVSPDGATLAAAGDEGVIRLFHLPERPAGREPEGAWISRRIPGLLARRQGAGLGGLGPDRALVGWVERQGPRRAPRAQGTRTLRPILARREAPGRFRRPDQRATRQAMALPDQGLGCGLACRAPHHRGPHEQHPRPGVLARRQDPGLGQHGPDREALGHGHGQAPRDDRAGRDGDEFGAVASGAVEGSAAIRPNPPNDRYADADPKLRLAMNCTGKRSSCRRRNRGS